MLKFQARLLRPARPETADWAFFVLPSDISAALPSRSQVSVEGQLQSVAFETTLEPDGKGGHWMRVAAELMNAARAAPGDTVVVTMSALAREPEPVVPEDWAAALAAQPAARATWDDITPVARRDWIQWIRSGKKAETRAKRIATACDMLAKGKRRACCFDRSGIYSGAFSAPEAAGQSDA